MEKRLFASILVFVVAAFVAGCGSTSSTVTTNPTITSVTASASPASITTADTSQCSVAVTGTGDYSSAVTWSATGGTISSSGVFTPSGAGNATCKATSTEDSTKSGSATITVTAVSTVTSVKLAAASATVASGGTDAITPTVAGTGSFTDTVNFTVAPSSAGTLSASTNVASGTPVTFTASSTLSAATSVTITACSTQTAYTTVCGPTTITVEPEALPAVTITAAPATITLGQTTTLTWTTTGSYTSLSVSGPGFATTSSPNGSSEATPTATGTATYTITATNARGTVSATATVTVNAVSSITSVVATCNPTSISTKQTSTCTAKVSGTGPYSVAVTWTATDGTISASSTSATFTPSGTGSAKITAKSTQDSTQSGSATITVTIPPTPVVTSITPRVQLCPGQCGFPQITVYGSGFLDGDNNVTDPNANIQLADLINSGETIITLGIDQVHEGSGDRSLKVCDSDGTTGCSNQGVFGLYYQNMCAEGTTDVFCLNPQETVAGQHLWPNGPDAGQPENGYVDVFTLAGVYERNFFVGSPTATGLATDNISGYILVGASVSDDNGNHVLFPTGGPNGTITGVAAYGDYGCILQASANNLGCFSLAGGSSSNPPSPAIANVTVGNNPQSLAMGEVNGKVYAFVLTSASGGATTIESVDVSDGMTDLTSKPVTGITAGAPGGSAIITLDSLGTGVIVSYADNIAIPFSETTLDPESGITLPGLPVNVVADVTNGVALVGNANATTPGGNITVVDPIAGTATVKTSDASPFLPTGLAVIPSDNDFLSCSPDGGPCTVLPLP